MLKYENPEPFGKMIWGDGITKVPFGSFAFRSARETGLMFDPSQAT